jgi:hypothetical protein
VARARGRAGLLLLAHGLVLALLGREPLGSAVGERRGREPLEIEESLLDTCHTALSNGSRGTCTLVAPKEEWQYSLLSRNSCSGIIKPLSEA